jgi:hypothetical protein
MKVKQKKTKPCTFCKSPDNFINFKADYTKYWVQCKKCIAHGSWCSTAKEAIDAWNGAQQVDQKILKDMARIAEDVSNIPRG